MPRLFLMLVAYLGVGTLALGCSLRYGGDDLRSDDGQGTGEDAGDDGSGQGDGGGGQGDGGGGGSADSGMQVADAGDPGPDAAIACKEPGTNCGDEEFIECTDELICEACGHEDEPCCADGPQCEAVLGLLCLGLLCGLDL